MCAVSMIGDKYTQGWPENPLNPWKIDPYPQPFIPGGISQQVIPQAVSRAEFDALKKEVIELKKLLVAAKQFDEATGQKDCEMEDKVALLKKIAQYVGVDLSEVFKS